MYIIVIYVFKYEQTNIQGVMGPEP